MSYLINLYNHYMEELSDPKTKDWMLNKPPVLLSFLIPYLIFCTLVGPAYMKNRSPYKLTRIIQIYNISQVILNTVLITCGLYSIAHYNWICQPVDRSLDPDEVRVATVGWFYCASKIYDLLDTVFFVLRKKFNQVTPLHLYHHIVMAGPFVFGSNFFTSGHVVFPFGMNMIVHIFMYTYYFIASLGPEYHKYLWWKKNLTQLQLVQFVLSFIHSFNAVAISCDVPLFVTVYFMGQSMTFTYLFGNFYIQTYLKNKSSPNDIKKEGPSTDEVSKTEATTIPNGTVEHKKLN